MAVGNAADAFISEDGRFVEFMVSAALDPGDVNGVFDVYLRALESGTTTLVSAGTNPYPSFASSISDDGRYAGYGILQPSSPTVGLVRDTVAGGTSFFNASAFPTGISADGLRVVESVGSLQTPTSVWIRGAGIEGRFFPTALSFHMNMSPDGRWATLSSLDDAVSGLPDDDRIRDVYLVDLDAPAPDTTPPVLAGVPSALDVDATSPAGAMAQYELPTATDNVDGALPVSCSPPSGSTFAIGSTDVTCTAADAAGNASSATFGVHVRGAAEQITALSAEVQDLSDPHLARTLGAKLTDALSSLQAGKTAKACRSLDAFSRQVEQRAGKAIPSAQAEAWLADAARIRAVIGC
jgi:hypothetical protein